MEILRNEQHLSTLWSAGRTQLIVHIHAAAAGRNIAVIELPDADRIDAMIAAGEPAEAEVVARVQRLVATADSSSTNSRSQWDRNKFMKACVAIVEAQTTVRP